MTPEIPQPSSRTEELGVRTECAVRGDEGEEIHSAKRGVTFQRTGDGLEHDLPVGLGGDTAKCDTLGPQTEQSQYFVKMRLERVSRREVQLSRMRKVGLQATDV